jgi:predicted nucleotidyltransferase
MLTDEKLVIMNTIIRQNIENIKMLAQKHHIKRLSLFGSAATGDFTAKSDIDFLYTFDLEALPIEEYADLYFGFLYSLRDLLKREVDLVSESNVSNKYFKKEIESTKVLLYESAN